MDATKLYFLIFGGLTIVGGIIGYVKAGSLPSIIAGAITGVLLLTSSRWTGHRIRYFSFTRGPIRSEIHPHR